MKEKILVEISSIYDWTFLLFFNSAESAEHRLH